MISHWKLCGKGVGLSLTILEHFQRENHNPQGALHVALMLLLH